MSTAARRPESQPPIKKIIILLTLLLWTALGSAQTDSTPSAEQKQMKATGTYYADRFVGRHTSSGEIFRHNLYTAAHRTYPFGTYLLVTNPRNGLQVVVRINDRCPVRNVVDMTKTAAYALGMTGTQKVSFTVLPPEVGKALWEKQDTTILTREAHLAFKDKSARKRISPYQEDLASAPPAHKNRSGKKGRPKPALSNEAPALPHEKKDDSTVADKTNVTSSQPRVVILSQDRPAADAPADTASTNTAGLASQQLYDIELSTVGSNQAAIREINRLPEELRPYVTLYYNQYNRQARVTLALGCPRNEAVRTLALLTDHFPNCIIVPASPNKPLETEKK